MPGPIISSSCWEYFNLTSTGKKVNFTTLYQGFGNSGISNLYLLIFFPLKTLFLFLFLHKFWKLICNSYERAKLSKIVICNFKYNCGENPI